MLNNSNRKKLNAAGVLVALGIVFGDIGTSPLYVLKAIFGEAQITRELVFAGVSFIFWTLTIQTSIKYVYKTLAADNHGEGGIMSLFSLIRRAPIWVFWAAIVGACTLLADGLITPPISISSAVEGLQALPYFAEINTTYIAIAIMSVLFFSQRFGTEMVGRFFGPVMVGWFAMLAILGIGQIAHHPEILGAINPLHALFFLIANPGKALIIGGAVFLCTTGAEALYSDLGHCGRSNIRVAWIGVKTALILNYMGQSSWLLDHIGETLQGRNPFYSIMPQWFLLAGVAIATMATIIASQALISGSYTLVAESIKLGLQPKMRIVYPTNDRGQLYIPAVNNGLWAGCIGVELLFRTSGNMEAAYGLAITLTMLVTTTLLLVYLYQKRYSKMFLITWGVTYYTVEGFFLASNLEKIEHGGWVSLVMASIFFFTYFVWIRYEKLKKIVTKSFAVSIYEFSNKVKKITSSLTDVIVLLSKEERKIDGRLLQIIQGGRRARLYIILHVTESNSPFDNIWEIVEQSEKVLVVNLKRGFRMPSNIGKDLRTFLDQNTIQLPKKVNGYFPVFWIFGIENQFVEGPWFVRVAEVIKAILGTKVTRYYFPNAENQATFIKKIHE